MRIFKKDLLDLSTKTRMTYLYLKLITGCYIIITFFFIFFNTRLKHEKEEAIRLEVHEKELYISSQHEIEHLKYELTKLQKQNLSQENLIKLIAKDQRTKNLNHQERLETNLLKTKQNWTVRYELEDALFKSDIYQKVWKIANAQTEKKFTQENWKELLDQFDQTYDNLLLHIKQIGKNISEDDVRLCCLSKLHFKNKGISELLNKTETAISSEKSRMYKKITNNKGVAADFQKLIDSL